MVVKVIELVASSSTSWEDAVRTALRESAQTLRHITAVDVVKQSAHVDDNGEIVEYRATIHVAFGVEHPTQLIGNIAESAQVN